MKRTPVFKILMPAMSCFIVVMLLLFSLYTYNKLKLFYMSENADELTVAAEVFQSQISVSNKIDYAAAEKFCESVFGNYKVRYTVILSDGNVLCDSWHNSSEMDSHSDRNEVIRIINGDQYAMSTRYSSTVGKNMLYVAVPFLEHGRVVAVLRVSRPLADIREQFSAFLVQPVMATIIMLLMAVFVIFMISKKISTPLEELKNVAVKFTNGNAEVAFPHSNIEEIDILSLTMDNMVSKLKHRIMTITKQRDEERALLMNMTEAVLVVNRDRELIKVNRAAEHMFNFNAEDVINKKLVKVLYNSDLLETVDRVFASNSAVEASMRADSAQGPCCYRVHGVKIPSVNIRDINAIFVITDITQIRKLETVRQDFVANVSHELRTPITSIIGFAETLVDDRNLKHKDREHFIAIIYKQANRMKTIIDDLLVLSRLEYKTDMSSLEFMPVNLSDVVDTAVQSVRKTISAANVKVLHGPHQKVIVNINVQLIELAIQNLIINAVKYSKQDHDEVQVKVYVKGNEAIVEVKDFGMGIPPECIDRIFERFYRVDKGRSRKVGGTGLGLSLVKRISMLHAGHVSVESKSGHGSTFYLHLPFDSAIV